MNLAYFSLVKHIDNSISNSFDLNVYCRKINIVQHRTVVKRYDFSPSGDLQNDDTLPFSFSFSSEQQDPIGKVRSTALEIILVTFIELSSAKTSELISSIFIKCVSSTSFLILNSCISETVVSISFFAESSTNLNFSSSSEMLKAWVSSSLFRVSLVRPRIEIRQSIFLI